MSQMFRVSTKDADGPIGTALPKIPAHLLVCFSAVAEQKSVAHAATVQCIPYVQMAQHIARLEGLIGGALIDPKPGIFRLTPMGEKLSVALNPDILALQKQAHGVLSDPMLSNETAEISVGLGVWGLASVLHPYLSDLRGLDCGLNFVPPQRISETKPDVICYLGRHARPGYEIEPLFGEEVITVCAARYPVPKGGFNGSSLKYEPLLQLGHPDHSEDWHGFLGLDPDGDLPGISKEPYKSFSTYLRAVKSGRGLGVGLAPLFAAEITAGTLQLASPRRVWRNRSVFVGVAKDSNYLTHARDFANILRRAFADIGQVGQ